MKKQRKKKTLAFKNAVAGYLFIAPFILGFILFMIVPLGQSLMMTFNEVNLGTGGFDMNWVGIKNYMDAFTVDPEFVPFLLSEISTMLLNTPATLIFSLGIEYNNALLQDMKDVISSNTNDTSVTGVLESILITSDSSPMSMMFMYVFQIIDKVYDIAIASGIQIIMFLSALQTISPSMFEAAKIEGCTAWESFWKITFPMVSSMILVNVVYTVIDFFLKTDNTVMTKISEEVGKLNYGFSSAMAWVYFLCVIIILGIVSLIISKRVYYYE